MVFVDSNIFMYAAGSAHKHKIASVAFLHRVAAKKIECCINTEILQEILHRYRYIGRWEDGKEVYYLTKSIVPLVVPVVIGIMDIAYRLLQQYPSIYARDAVHAATCIEEHIDTIISFDKDFDVIEALQRTEPEDI
jgi:uncharacterized protein